MYLKSIEIQGFKSFANKIVFEFHDGITAIVGPNGSGKSNVADAVRWVLGEQSAKQLRGTNMQDVIFSGSEARKPLGFAYVEITFDNSDHKLAIAYDEVSVSRRVYRSGESEYMINGIACRLRDVQELFMDTGIGKEGYSIIGQGQIDKILSTKPEDRRELFDEAAGIVKFKKRKSIAEKNLEEAGDNLSRIMDIISEIERQIGPLEKQSKVAKEYFRLRDILKNLELNSFITEYERFDAQRSALEEKYNIAVNDLNDTKAANENAGAEYTRLEGILEEHAAAIEAGQTRKSELLIGIEKMEGEIKLFEQQLLAINQNSERINERIAGILEEIEQRTALLSEFSSQKEQYDASVRELEAAAQAANDAVNAIRSEISELSSNIEAANTSILKLMNDDSSVKSDLQRYNTMLEQVSVRRSELAGKLIRSKSELEESRGIAAQFEEDYNEVSGRLLDTKAHGDELFNTIREISDTEKKLAGIYDEARQRYLAESSRLESLKNLAERYEGYNQTIRRIMENKDRFEGIEGVVADLISVEKKYETAVEVALGASISHIVTTDEQVAKSVIEFLKKDKLGRATFLPITSVGRRKNENDPLVMKEKGVISDAAELVSCDDKYKGVINHLLKNFIVVDNVDNALALARKYEYTLRIVTLEGEQLAPGGSIAGGSFKNSANLLGRKREISEAEEKVEKLNAELENIRKEIESTAERKKSVRDELDSVRNRIQELMVEQNSLKLKLEKELQLISELEQKLKGYDEETRALEEKTSELNVQISSQKKLLKTNAQTGDDYRKSIDAWNGRLIELRFGEGEAVEKVNAVKLEIANTSQAGRYAIENIERINGEIDKMTQDREDIIASSKNSRQEAEAKQEEIRHNRAAIEESTAAVAETEAKLAQLQAGRDKINNEHKSFFEAWAELGKRVTELEKEVLRLGNQKEKLEAQIELQTNYIWEEYQLTYAGALDWRDPEFKVSTARKDINDTKASIKALGDVNVNAIEEYRTVSERYSLLTTQRDDLIESKNSIQAIINELDDEMRKQFTEQFALIQKEFNNVFRELFGGGKGELELIEEEDILDAGIRIIAQPPGKKLQNMMQLSGGEKALTAIALLFAIQNLKPSPFCLLDEIEAALDDSNVKRFASYLKKLTKSSQFIVITHRRGTMNSADILYGITMQEKGVSTLVSVSLIEGDLSS